MNQAICTDDGKIYNAVDFSDLFPAEMESKRRHLQCPECYGPAFFRHTSPIGRAPCFGARPHAAGCSLAAYDLAQLQSMVEDEISNSSETIVVDLRYGAPVQLTNMACAERSPVSEDLGYRSFPPNLRTHRRPSSLLRLLRGYPAFGSSDQAIEIFLNERIAARDLFVPLCDATACHEGQFRGFWGPLQYVTVEDQTVWFNSGDWRHISFCLDTRLLSDLIHRCRVSSVEDLASADILVFGTLRISQQGKLFCVIEALERLALCFN